jgi:hypothetical protein
MKVDRKVQSEEAGGCGMENVKTGASALGTRRSGGRAYFGAGVVLPDGSVEEFCGLGRRWPSVDAFHRERAGREANLIVWFPAEDRGCDGPKKSAQAC